MADITVTEQNTIAQAGATIQEGTAGGTILAGQSIYMDAADGNSLKPAQHDGTEAEAAAVGIALNGASDGQPVKYCSKGPIVLGGTPMTVGVTYCVGAGAGGIAPDSDVGSSDFKTVLGVALTTGILQMNINVSGVELA